MSPFGEHLRNAFEGRALSRHSRRDELDLVLALDRSDDLFVQDAGPETAYRAVHDAFHLSKTFKRHTDLSPREFRRRQGETLP